MAVTANASPAAIGARTADWFFRMAEASPGAQQAGADIWPAAHEIPDRHMARVDRRLTERVTDVLEAEAQRQRARDVHVSVSGGIVHLFGAVRDCSAARDIETAVRLFARADEIRNEISTIGARSGD